MRDSFTFPSVSNRAATAFNAKAAALAQKTQQLLRQSPEWNDIARNSFPLFLDDNATYQAAFMSNVLATNDEVMLRRTVYWVLEMCTARGISPLVYQNVIYAKTEAIRLEMNPQDAAEIIAVYDWMLELIEKMIFSQCHADSIGNKATPLEPIVHELVVSLLNGCYSEANAIVDTTINSGKSLHDIYVGMITPAMHKIGLMWEMGEITVAREHMATSIIMRLLAGLFCRTSFNLFNKGRIVIGACANELHEVGARVIADLLEADGWDVTYAGANVPTADFIKLVSEIKPDILGISITMAMGLKEACAVIQGVRAACPDVKILVGGQAFDYIDSNINTLGADWVIQSAGQAVVLAEEWWNERT